MREIVLDTTKEVLPMIYAYTTPEIKRHDGWTKIGYTEQNVEDRIYEQTHTADVEVNIEWTDEAKFEDGSNEYFKDHDFHKYLRKKEYKQDDEKNNEWFKITGDASHRELKEFKKDRGILKLLTEPIVYNLRDEQKNAVEMTKKYYENTEFGEFLWNAKPRFGKTLSVYDFVKKIDAEKVLIVTNRPVIANSWYQDYVNFLGDKSGYKFVSETDALKNEKYVINREQYVHLLTHGEYYKSIEFVSLQDIKGSIYFGGKIDKLREIADNDWDVLVIDEAHEGVDTYKTDVAFNHINRKFTLHLSGTPFKALANEKFKTEAIYNWTYKDEQEMKDLHKNEEDSPYNNLPKLNLLTYQMSEIVKDELKKGIDIDNENQSYAFDLNEFFSTKNGKFIYDKEVDKFLDALTTLKKFPFSTEELRNELHHTFWLLDRVESAKAMYDKLKNHSIFKKYKLVLAAGDGRTEETEEIKKSYNKVKEAIENNEYTITLSVGQLTTGVTIPEWTGVLMLSNIKSPALYMQAVFRAQNPCMFSKGDKCFRKENAYIFDFDPARTLKIYEEFANDLSKELSNGAGTSEDRKENIKKLLNFFPVLAEDENGEMIDLDAEKVLVLPRKILSKEVVRCGFMSNLLFQNISNVFHANSEVFDILSKMPSDNTKARSELNIDDNTKNDLSINENGDVELSDEFVIGRSNDVFGEKIYDIENKIKLDQISNIKNINDKKINDVIEKTKNNLKDNIVNNIIEITKEAYNNDSKIVDTVNKKIKKQLDDKIDFEISKIISDYNISLNILENEKNEKKQSSEKYEEKKEEIMEKLNDDLNNIQENIIDDIPKVLIKEIETTKREVEKEDKEDRIKDHLRGFARTIPSFLMAYGDVNTKLDNFDTIIPENVFIEVTGITIDNFKTLRDTYNIFDEIIFNDSVREFINKKEALSNYFSEDAIEDIFDYIPPQKINQIFTPKKVVYEMIDLLEKENKGCFDDDSKTFADLYMKSGLYIAEIVKRLYRSKKMKEKYKDDNERLRHIFEHQIYGLAPTEIIYKIAYNYILGFDKNDVINKHNLRMSDVMTYINDGLGEKLDEVFK